MGGPDQDLPISRTIGYMLKIMKSGKDFTKFKEAFDAIRHGNYDQFFKAIKQPPTDALVVATVSENGTSIKSENFSLESGDCDIAMILYVGPGLKHFATECLSEFGEFRDAEVTNDIFNKCAAFEIALRTHTNNGRSANNNPARFTKKSKSGKLNTPNLTDVINELCLYKSLTDIEKTILHEGREFLNWIKHLNDPKFNTIFNSFHYGIKAFEAAWDLCGDKAIRISK